MSRLIETIRVADGRIDNLDYHIKRIEGSSKIVFGRSPSWLKDNVFTLAGRGENIFKYRIVYDATQFEYSITPYTIRPVRSLKLVFDNNIVYDHKYEDRRELERLLAQRGDCDDVLIVKNNLVTDISYANIAFRKGDDWFTPDSFLLNGTMRQRLLDLGRIIERTITVDDIRQFTHFRPINAMLREDAPESEVLNIR